MKAEISADAPLASLFMSPESVKRVQETIDAINQCLPQLQPTIDAANRWLQEQHPTVEHLGKVIAQHGQSNASASA